MAVAFFDLDLTILDVNSASLWIRAERRAKRITRSQLLRSSWALLKYRFGVVDLEPLIREAMNGHRGQLESEFVERIEAFYEREICTRMRPGAAGALSRHHEAGDDTVILTTSSLALARACAEGFGFSEAIGSQLEVDHDGRFSGRPCEPLCYGSGKVIWAQRWCAEHGMKLDEATFYTDSVSDLPMLEAVGTPVVVHGDHKLERLARERNWSVCQWGSS